MTNPLIRGGWAAACFLACVVAHAADRAPQICPLSDEQTEKSIEAFAKLVPTFHHPRCERCHGALDIFPEDTEHGGGPQENDHSGCMDSCHTEVPPREIWQLPNKDHMFINKDAKTLCKQMHETRTGPEFIEHVSTDALITIAFMGTRAFTPDDLKAEKMVAEPPPITHEEFNGLAKAWVDTTGGDFKGDDACGCEPAHYAVRISYERTVNLLVKSTERMGPVDIPIKFHDDGTFEGEQTVYFNGESAVMVCTASSTSSMNLKVSGDVSGPKLNETMSLKIENTSVRKTTATAICPYLSKTAKVPGGNKASVEEDGVTADVGAKVHFNPGSSPAITTSIDAQMVKLGQ